MSTYLEKRVILPLTRIFVSASNAHEVGITIPEVKPEHLVFILINVIQDQRGVLDIGVSVMDDINYQKWSAKQPSSAYLIAHRIKFGSLVFKPKTAGFYHVILDNLYSILTGKQVEIEISEIFEKAKEIAPVAEKPKEKIRYPFWKRVLNRFFRSRFVQTIILLVTIQLVCFFLAIGIASLFHSFLGLEPKDSMGYIGTAIGGSAVAVSTYLLVELYMTVTGRHPPTALTQAA